MSIRCGSTSLIPGAIVCGVPGLGVLGSTILATTGSGGSGPGILFNDVQPGDENKEFRAEVLTWPSAGSIDLQEDGSFTYTGTAPDTLTYRLWVDGVSVGTASVALYGTTVDATVGGQGGTIKAGAGSVSVDLIAVPPGTVTAQASGSGATVKAGAGGVSVTVLAVLPVITVAAQGQGATIKSGSGGVFISDGSIVWPVEPAGPTHRAIVPFYGVRAIVTAETIE